MNQDEEGDNELTTNQRVLDAINEDIKNIAKGPHSFNGRQNKKRFKKVTKCLIYNELQTYL